MLGESEENEAFLLLFLSLSQAPLRAPLTVLPKVTGYEVTRIYQLQEQDTTMCNVIWVFISNKRCPFYNELKKVNVIEIATKLND